MTGYPVATPALAQVEAIDPERLAVAIVTRNRIASLRVTLDALRALPERPSVVVVDNGSTDGTAAAVSAEYRDVHVVRLPRNLGSAGRTVAATVVDAEYVAFCDDDSGWAPGSLTRAAALLDRHDRVGLVAGKILVGPTQRVDPVCAEMAFSPIARGADQPGVAVLGFVACGAVVRRSAFLEVGGFNKRYGIGGEERLLAIDLFEGGWELSYVDDIVALHRPEITGPRPDRVAHQVRNDLWTAWLRLPARDAAAVSIAVLRAVPQRAGLRGLTSALSGTGFVVRGRRRVSADTAAQLRLISP